MNEIESVDDPYPLVTLANSRTREIAALCRTVERGCRAIGFRADSSHERVATLIARLAGSKVLRKTATEIAEDKNVGCSERQVRRAIEELVEFDVVSVEYETTAPTRRRGRPPQIYLLKLRLDDLRSVVCKAEKWEAEHRGEVVSNHSGDFRTCSWRPSDKDPAKDRHIGGEVVTKSRHFEGHSSLALNTNASSPSPEKESATTAEDWKSVVGNLQDAGIDRIHPLVGEAKSAGMTPTELREAAYVVQHTSSLSPGALFDYVRSGGWPASGVKPAKVIRSERTKRAERIRGSTRDDAPEDAGEEIVLAVAAQRMLDVGLVEQLTDLERIEHARWLEFKNAKSLSEAVT